MFFFDSVVFSYEVHTFISINLSENVVLEMLQHLLGIDLKLLILCIRYVTMYRSSIFQAQHFPKENTMDSRITRVKLFNRMAFFI